MNGKLERILSIDDDPDILAIIRVSLGTIGGFSLGCSLGGDDGIQLAARSCPDLILLDVMMPGLDGPETLRRLRKQASTENTPVLFMTARVGVSQIEEYRALGAADVIAKPFDPVLLPNQVRAIWARLQPEP